MNIPKHKVLAALALVCAILAFLGYLGVSAGNAGLTNAKRMESFEWIRNDRCEKKVVVDFQPGEPFRFAVFGDIQSGTAQLPRLLEAVDGEPKPAFIIQTGDAVSHADPGHYKVLLRALARSELDLPMFVVPGNHDVDDDDDSLFRRYFGETPLWFKYGGALFVLLDNSSGPFTDEQYDWMENVIEEQSAPGGPIFLFMHRQPIHWEGDGKEPVEHLYERLFQILKEHEVDYVFTGHWHGYHREKRDGTDFIVNGRGGDFGHDNRLVSSYLTTVEVEDGAVNVTKVELPPRVGPLITSLVNDWLYAHLGELATKNRWVTFLIIIAALAGSVYSVRIIRKSRAGAGNISEDR